MKRNDVRVLQLPEHLRFLEEAPAHRIRIGMLDLERDAAQQRLVARQVNGRHAASADFSEQRIALRIDDVVQMSRLGGRDRRGGNPLCGDRDRRGRIALAQGPFSQKGSRQRDRAIDGLLSGLRALGG